MKIVIGQDPYPDLSKRVCIADYPISEVVAFWQPTNNKNDVAYQRFLGLVNDSKKQFPDIHNELMRLKKENYYFFNYFSKLHKKGERRKSNKIEILEFIKEKNTFDNCYIALIGSTAKLGLEQDLKKMGIPKKNIFTFSHPSGRNASAARDWSKISKQEKSIFQI